MMFSLILLAILGALFSVWLKRRCEHFKYFEKRGIPGPKPNLWFGNSLEMWRKSQPGCLQEWGKQYGNVYGYFNGAVPILVVTDKVLLKEIMIKRFSSFMNHGNIFGTTTLRPSNLFVLTGQQWRHMRATLSPSFTMKKLKAISGEMSQIVNEFLEHFEQAAATGEKLELHRILKALTTDMICRLGLGINYGAIKNPEHPIMGRIASVVLIPYNLMLIVLASFPSLRFLLPPAVIFLETLQNRADKMKNPGKLIMEDCSKVIQMRRKDPAARRNDLLQMLLDAKYETANDENLAMGGTLDKGSPPESISKAEVALTDEEVLQNAWLLMIAGYETTATILTGLAFILMRRPDIQEKLRQELFEAVTQKKKLDIDTIQKLPYMDAVMKEALRMYASPIFVSRSPVEDIQLQEGLTLKKNDVIVVPIEVVHMKEEFFEEPFEFRPERFINGEVDPITFTAFGNGPRNCLGMRFAQMEIKLTLTQMLTRYKVEATEDTPEKFHLVAMAALKVYPYDLNAKITKLSSQNDPRNLLEINTS